MKKPNIIKPQLEIEQLKNEIGELKAGWQRTQADFENYRNRTAKERLELIQSANRDLIEQILPVLDNFNIALSHRPSLLSHPELVSGSHEMLKQVQHDNQKQDSSSSVQNDTIINNNRLKQINDYITGLEYTKIQLEQILTNYGLEKIPAKIGDQFDPTIHEAVEAVEDKKLKKDQIAQIVSNGYQLNSTLIRPVKVKVVK